MKPSRVNTIIMDVVHGRLAAPFDRQIDMREFSESDLECLDEVLGQCRGKTADELDDVFRDGIFRESWRFAPFRIDLDVIAFMLPNAQAVLDLLRAERQAAELEASVEENRSAWDERDAIRDTF